jgi:hypothetical protein
MDGLCLNMMIHPFCEKYGLATVAVQVQDLLNYTSIDPMVQRKLSHGQRRKISNYLMERELDRVFFGPVTLSLRDVSLLAKAEKGLFLRPGSKLSVLDGQHRILALGYVNEQLQKEVRSHERKVGTLVLKQRREPEDGELKQELEQMQGLAVQIYIGLSEEEEKQLFGDINSKVQLVSKELGHSFDSIDPLNLVIQQVVDHNMFLKSAGVERRANLTSYNKNFSCFSWLYSTATMLFTGKMQPSYELARKIRQDPSTYIEILHQFYSTLLPLMPEQPGLPQYSSANRAMQESIALYANGYLFKNGEYTKDWIVCLGIFEGFDWSHENRMLIDRFGVLDNSKLNLIHEKSLRKHGKLVQLFRELNGEPAGDEASSA